LLQDVRKLKAIPPGSLIIPPGPRLGGLVIEAINISKRMDSKILFENVSFLIPSGAIIGIVGPNGSGKTSLLNILCGDDKPDSGKVKIGESVKIAYVSQSRLDQLNPEKNYI